MTLAVASTARQEWEPRIKSFIIIIIVRVYSGMYRAYLLDALDRP